LIDIGAPWSGETRHGRSSNSPELGKRGEDGEIATPVPRAGCMTFWEEPILAEIRGRS